LAFLFFAFFCVALKITQPVKDEDDDELDDDIYEREDRQEVRAHVEASDSGSDVAIQVDRGGGRAEPRVGRGPVPRRGRRRWDSFGCAG
jgi:hypothetical protein